MWRRKRRRLPKKRVVDPRLASRVEHMNGQALFIALDNTLMGIATLVDAYHYHDAPADEVSVAIDTVYAVWTEILNREV